MVYRGTIQNGVVVFDETPQLPDGTQVEIQPVEPPQQERGTVEAILGSSAHWHGTAEEMDRLLAEIKQSKQEELKRQLAQPEPRL
jgi:hypothetical protein